MKTVYLAGPIAGLSGPEAAGWRNDATKFLAQFNIRGISPLRDEPPNAEGRYISAAEWAGAPKDKSAAVGAKNIFDTRQCDMILAYLPYIPNRASYGTVWEIGAGYALGKPLVLVSNDPAIYSHPDIAMSAGWHYLHLDEGLARVVAVLGPYA